ncbi:MULTISPECIES: hypothetical protein [Halorubrum]|uniref:Uncharacterized protein n=1 Tax=Halorubrum hochstenium ATCC 700873 TaxID=1227481 RepID=M0FL33_9EURY|nr:MULTISPECIES: hypothetical protein [Halorubrum]ELZ59299.1 hypothetical protein C467_03456 [Halorubrum hochstenium ATCC 700873]
MSLHEAEKRRSGQDDATNRDPDRSGPDDAADDGPARPTGVPLVAALGFLSGLTDLLTAVAFTLDALLLLAVPIGAIGAAKWWAAVELVLFRAHGLGLSVLFFGFGAAVSAAELLFAVGTGGGLRAPIGGLALDVAVVGYLFAVADAFD